MTTPTDFFDNTIEVGDRYFYGSPTVIGVVHSVKKTSIEIQLIPSLHNYYGNGHLMKCKSPYKGICLDKISIIAETRYKVSWQLWTGIEPCGRAEYKSFSQLFTDYEEAQKCFNVKNLHYDYAKLTKTITELLDKSDDYN